MMKVKLFTITTLLFVALLGAKAQDENLKMRFNFEKVSGTSVTDEISGVTARVMSSAKVTEMGEFHVLELGNGTGYLDMTAEAGKVFAACEDYTVSVYYRVSETATLSGNGFFLWAFSTLTACTSSAGVYSAYRLNAQRIASSPSGYGSEVGYSVGSASAQGSWVHVAYTQSGNIGRLYINGELQSAIAAMPKNSTLFSSTTAAYCWLGRAPFSGDNYLKNTTVYDFCLYDRALTADEVFSLSNETLQLEISYIHGSQGDNTALLTTITNAKTLLADSQNYLPDAVADLQSLISIGETVAAGKFSQSYMDNIRTQIISSMSTVRSTANITLPTAQDMEAAYDTERGFIHPGGMHTQADFDRIKAQIAAGNSKVISAHNVLKSAAYAQSSVQTYPVETIVRGGGTGENYINAARGATMAYQNALRWKIEDNKACAAGAVRILMAWANTCKYVSGDSNYALAAGLYGYQFAQAAELMRDYEGWSREDFNQFKEWMMNVWYPSCIGFLRGRNGTWENSANWGPCPGHYWSNWGLCNVMAVISIGILCDDVYIYNQGMSYFKYDQVGTFKDPRTEVPIKNDGLNEFLGNLVVTTSESDLETGAYGKLGQMQESGRDIGHVTMSAGLALDVAKVGWNQGDDLFSYMDHRLAAGIEYVAAETQSIANLPWTNYHYASNGLAWYDSRAPIHTAPALGAQIRPYWATAIGIYEGVKGVTMPYSEMAYEQMGIDGGGQGSTSGGYDHLGYSVLMNTYDGIASPEKVPTELTPKMEMDGKEIAHNELGGLVNTYTVNTNTCVARGKSIKLMPQLPDGVEDTGKWLWESGETTKDITVQSDRSHVYRVTYTNTNGIQSSQCFSIAVENDCQPTQLTASMTYDGQTYATDTLCILYGKTATLSISPACGWGTYRWSTGQTTSSITTVPVVEPRDYTAYYTNQGSGVTAKTFHIDVVKTEPFIIASASTVNDTTIVVSIGEKVTLGINLPTVVDAADVEWQDGSKGNTYSIDSIYAGGSFTATFTLNGEAVSTHFTIHVKDTESSRFIEPGNYLIRYTPANTYLTAHEINELATFEAGDAENLSDGQVWFIDRKTTARYRIISLPDSLRLSTLGKVSKIGTYSFLLQGEYNTENYAIFTNATAPEYWGVADDGTILPSATTTLSVFPFELIPVDYVDGISVAHSSKAAVKQDFFTLDGIRLNTQPNGLCIVRTVMADGSVKVEKRYSK